MRKKLASLLAVAALAAAACSGSATPVPGTPGATTNPTVGPVATPAVTGTPVAPTSTAVGGTRRRRCACSATISTRLTRRTPTR